MREWRYNFSEYILFISVEMSVRHYRVDKLNKIWYPCFKSLELEQIVIMVNWKYTYQSKKQYDSHALQVHEFSKKKIKSIVLSKEIIAFSVFRNRIFAFNQFFFWFFRRISLVTKLNIHTKIYDMILL